ncbi:MAG: hypothetical protein K9L85_04100 [Candidatus Peribacteraceae bacterium]|nr:hypothetical protein [Candidatus Peribacteraceae bacterium]
MKKTQKVSQGIEKNTHVEQLKRIGVGALRVTTRVTLAILLTAMVANSATAQERAGRITDESVLAELAKLQEETKERQFPKNLLGEYRIATSYDRPGINRLTITNSPIVENWIMKISDGPGGELVLHFVIDGKEIPMNVTRVSKKNDIYFRFPETYHGFNKGYLSSTLVLCLDDGGENCCGCEDGFYYHGAFSKRPLTFGTISRK